MEKYCFPSEDMQIYAQDGIKLGEDLDKSYPLYMTIEIDGAAIRVSDMGCEAPWIKDGDLEKINTILNWCTYSPKGPFEAWDRVSAEISNKKLKKLFGLGKGMDDLDIIQALMDLRYIFSLEGKGSLEAPILDWLRSSPFSSDVSSSLLGYIISKYRGTYEKMEPVDLSKIDFNEKIPDEIWNTVLDGLFSIEKDETGKAHAKKLFDVSSPSIQEDESDE